MAMKTEEQILSKAESLEKQLITLLTDELERNEKKQKEMQNMTLEVFLAQLIHGKTFIEFIDLIQKATLENITERVSKLELESWFQTTSNSERTTFLKMLRRRTFNNAFKSLQFIYALLRDVLHLSLEDFLLKHSDLLHLRDQERKYQLEALQVAAKSVNREHYFAIGYTKMGYQQKNIGYSSTDFIDALHRCVAMFRSLNPIDLKIDHSIINLLENHLKVLFCIGFILYSIRVIFYCIDIKGNESKVIS